MIEWSETDLIMRDTAREFIDKEIRPHLDQLESGEMSPFPLARRLFSEFGLDVMGAEAIKTMLDKERARASTLAPGEPETKKSGESDGGFGDLGAQMSMAAVMVSELSGVSLGLLSSIGVSLGLGAAPWLRRSAGCRS
jgi:alkylation response protein AidB-like acyl-CoA dehydrogenase